jgi:hypothetical protein
MARQFPFAEPIWVDADQRPFDELPEEYFSPFGWDAANQTVFRPISRFFAVDPAGEAVNVNALDEVPDSSWFENRIGRFGMSPERVAQGACTTPPLDPNKPWTVKGAKPDGANPGFVIKGPDDKRYLVKFDGVLQGPRATAADVIGSRLYHAAGYHSPCNRIVYFDRALLKIAPDASVEERDGERPLTEKDLETVLSKALRLSDGRYRASTSLFLEGKPIGPWTYQGTRDDDPNDVVAHEDRRELRGMRILAALINHFDSREQNTFASFVEVGKNAGYVRHYMLDFGDSLGSLWTPPMLGRRIGHAYYLDVPYVVEDWITLGLVKRPWESAEFGRSGAVFGYFDVALFEPELWRPGYPNPAFSRMSERDAAWMARIIAEFSDAHLEALVATADLRDPILVGELSRILKGRRDRILDRYLTRLSPLAHPRVERLPNGARLCLVDLLLSSGRAKQRSYVGRAYLTERRIELGQSRPDARARSCVTLPAVPESSSDKPRYLIVDVIARTPGLSAQLPARVHLYHLGGSDYRIVGLERPDSDRPL